MPLSIPYRTYDDITFPQKNRIPEEDCLQWNSHFRDLFKNFPVRRQTFQQGVILQERITDTVFQSPASQYACNLYLKGASSVQKTHP